MNQEELNTKKKSHKYHSIYYAIFGIILLICSARTFLLGDTAMGLLFALATIAAFFLSIFCVYKLQKLSQKNSSQ